MLILKSYLAKETILGYSASTSFFIMEHYEAIAGMVLSAVMIIASIILQWHKIKSLRNEEKRKQEKHEQDMQQDKELHAKNIENQ